MTGGRQQPWPDEVRQRALTLAAEVGVGRAARELEADGTNVSVNTIRSWLQREGKRAHEALELAGHVPVELLSDRAMSWHERRAALLPELGIAAASALEACKTAIRSGRSVDSRNYATTVGILCDKLNILGGGATSRSESFVLHGDMHEAVKLRAEIEALEKELADE